MANIIDGGRQIGKTHRIIMEKTDSDIRAFLTGDSDILVIPVNIHTTPVIEGLLEHIDIIFRMLGNDSSET